MVTVVTVGATPVSWLRLRAAQLCHFHLCPVSCSCNSAALSLYPLSSLSPSPFSLSLSLCSFLHLCCWRCLQQNRIKLHVCRTISFCILSYICKSVPHVSLYAYNYGHKSESVFAITIFTLVPQMCNCQFASANAGCAGGQVATNCVELLLRGAARRSQMYS